MKRTVAITLVVLVAVAAAWSAYAYAQGGGPLKRTNAAACQPACGPATQPCEKAQACHDGSACACDPADCPKFKDADRDGKCDNVGDCGRHSRPGCPRQANHRDGQTARHHGGCGGRCHLPSQETAE